MGLVSWIVALLIMFIVSSLVAVALILIGTALKITIPSWLVGLLAMSLGLFVVGPWLSYRVFDTINSRTSPKWHLHLQNRPIPPEHRVFKDGEERDIRWVRGWRVWLLWALFAAFWVFVVLFSD